MYQHDSTIPDIYSMPPATIFLPPLRFPSILQWRNILTEFLDVELCGDGVPAIRLLLYRSIPGYFNIAMLRQHLTPCNSSP